LNGAKFNTASLQGTHNVFDLELHISFLVLAGAAKSIGPARAGVEIIDDIETPPVTPERSPIVPGDPSGSGRIGFDPDSRSRP